MVEFAKYKANKTDFEEIVGMAKAVVEMLKEAGFER